MVSTDGKAFILNYVRNCFSSGDDSGFCEKLLNGVKSVSDEEIESILSGQFNYHSSSEIVDTNSDEFKRHYLECNFIPCEDPINVFNASIINCENSSDSSLPNKKNVSAIRQLSAEEVDKYFPSKPVVRTNKSSTICKSEKSGLTLALEQAKLSGHLKRNKLFSDFAIYDARSTLSTNHGVPNDRFFSSNIDPSLRQFNVWLWRVSGFPRTSVKVQPRLGTTVQQFIGLTLWQYFNEFTTSGSGDSITVLSRMDNLDESFLNRLALHMLDTLDDVYDGDDVDSEFPPLELNDPIHKYQFKSFALIERVDTLLEEAPKQEISRVLVTIHMAQGMSVLRFPSDTRLSTVLERAVYRRRLRQHGGYAYRLELWPRNTDQQQINNNLKTNNCMLNSTNSQFVNKNSQFDLSLPLSYFIDAGLPLHFLLVRESSRCDPTLSDQSDDFEATESVEPTLVLDTSIEPVHTALQLRQYQVTYLKGLFPT
ncbi:Target of rapamycin complex 2 subunit MAPKAP1 [Schistosoma japonicum]|nr:Target of rapamycin complex 2 subunit MAPKAP1 [Schistosoma japonicum]